MIRHIASVIASVAMSGVLVTACTSAAEHDGTASDLQSKLTASIRALHSVHIDWRVKPADAEPVKTVSSVADAQISGGKVTAARLTEFYLRDRSDYVIIGKRGWARKPWDDCYHESWQQFEVSGMGESECIQAGAGGLQHELAVISPISAATYVRVAKTVTRTGRNSFSVHVETNDLPDTLDIYPNATEIDFSIAFTRTGELAQIQASEDEGGGDVSTYTVTYTRSNAVPAITAPVTGA